MNKNITNLYGFQEAEEVLRLLKPIIDGVVLKAAPSEREDAWTACQESIIETLEGRDRHPVVTLQAIRDGRVQWSGYDPQKGSLLDYLEKKLLGGLAEFRQKAQEPVENFSDLVSTDDEGEEGDIDDVLAGQGVKSLAELAGAWEAHQGRRRVLDSLDDEIQAPPVVRRYMRATETTYQAVPGWGWMPTSSREVDQLLDQHGDQGIRDTESEGEEFRWWDRPREDDDGPDFPDPELVEPGWGTEIGTRMVITGFWANFAAGMAVFQKEPRTLEVRKFLWDGTRRDKKWCDPVEADDNRLKELGREYGLSENAVQDAFLEQDLRKAGMLWEAPMPGQRAREMAEYLAAKRRLNYRAMQRTVHALRRQGVVVKALAGGSRAVVAWKDAIQAMRQGLLVCSPIRLAAAIRASLGDIPEAVKVADELEAPQGAS